jgi:hypothetical protein
MADVVLTAWADRPIAGVVQGGNSRRRHGSMKLKSGLARVIADDPLLMRREMEAYHLAGHSVALQVLRSSVHWTSPSPDPDVLFGKRRPLTAPWTALERRLVVAAAGAAAEREQARRSGLHWRRTSNRCDGLEACCESIAEETGEDPGDWIDLRWIRAVARARRVLIGTWSEVVRVAGKLGPWSGLNEVGPCPRAGQTRLRHWIASPHAGRGRS